MPALDQVSLNVGAGEFVCILGASGCGKSTLLNLVAGLDRPTAGTVDVDGRTTLMFQEAALFPWLTARGNVELALKLQRVGKAEAAQACGASCSGSSTSRSSTASARTSSRGGMRQRVALARALAQGVDVLLMDEPFGALDAMTRDLLHDELERLWQEQGLTILFVTHNVREAVRLGDRVVLLSSRPGRVIAEVTRSRSRARGASTRHDVADLAATITDQLREEVRRHGDALRSASSRPGGAVVLDARARRARSPSRLVLPPAPSRRLAAVALGRRRGRKLPRRSAIDRAGRLAGRRLDGLEARVPCSRGRRKVFEAALRTTFSVDVGRGDDTLWRAVQGFAFSLVIGTIVGALVARNRILRAAIGSMITGLQTMPSVAWFPLAILAVQAHRGRRSSSSSCSARRRRSPTG